MKKFVLFMAFALLVACSVSAVYAVGSQDEANQYAMDGISVSSEDFSSVFSGNPNARTVIQEDTLSDSELLLADIVVDKNSVSVTASVVINDTIVELPICGTLGASYKTQTGINSAIVQVYGAVNGYEVLLFEIFNDTADDNLLLEYAGVGSIYSGTPHIKLYLKDSADIIYLFEAALPDELSRINASDFAVADKYKDLLWVLPYVIVTSEPIMSDDSLFSKTGAVAAPNGLNYFQTVVPAISFTSSYYFGALYCEHTSKPVFRYKHTNVPATDDWTFTFMISEHTRTTNTETGNWEVYYGTNPVEYEDLRLEMGCGTNTTFSQSCQQGKMYTYSLANGKTLYEAGSEIAVNLLTKAVSSYPPVLTVAKILEYIYSLIPERITVELGKPNNKLYGERTMAIGESVENYYLSERTLGSDGSYVGDYFMLKGSVGYEAENSTVNTHGAFRAVCTVYNGADDSYTPYEYVVDLSYSAVAPNT